MRAAHRRRRHGAGVLFGRERTGLTNEEVSLADAILTLPVDPAFASLNIAQAVLIVAYEWRICRGDAALPFDGGIAPQAPREQLIAHVRASREALDDAGFFRPPERQPHVVLALRAMLQRAGLTEQEVRTLRGMIAALERRPTRPRKARGARRDRRSRTKREPAARLRFRHRRPVGHPRDPRGAAGAPRSSMSPTMPPFPMATGRRRR